MSADRTAVTPPLKLTLKGRISSVDWYPRVKPTRHTTLIRLPAPDEYATPQTVEVVSNVALGSEGELVSVEVEVGGRYRSYQVTDKQTGELRTVRTADNVLTCTL